MRMEAHSTEVPRYAIDSDDGGDSIIEQALKILDSRVCAGAAMTDPATVRKFVTVRAAKHCEFEVFCVLFLNSQNCVIEFREMFRGTVSQTAVYPREVARAALALNASAVMLTHNHPSGVLEASSADIVLTRAITAALDLLDVKVLDHIITGGGKALSMAERGLLKPN